MSAGLFGKLPAKRDFIAVRAPTRFLGLWEPWLQAGIATSRLTLDSGWTAAFNRTPIWRFWLGAGLWGEATIGAFMPSIDGVGRLFPLAIFASEGDQALPPPEIESNDSWCEAAEAILLDALEPGAQFEDIAEAAAELASPARADPPAAPGVEAMPEGAVLARNAEIGAGRVFENMRRVGHRNAYASQSFWWTIGGEDFPPLALAVVGMPAATRFADMLTGAFGADPIRREESADGG
jgi:type VI secretion system protein ImpM